MKKLSKNDVVYKSSNSRSHLYPTELDLARNVTVSDDTLEKSSFKLIKKLKNR